MSEEDISKFAKVFVYAKLSTAISILKILATPEEFETMRETLMNINNRLSKECE